MNPLTLGAVAFSLGLLLGLAVDDLWDEMRHRSHPDTTTSKGTTMADPRRSLLPLWMLILSLAANAAVGGLLIKTRYDTGLLTDCVAEYNQRFSQSYQARTASAPETQAALDRLIIAVSKNDEPGFKVALADYVTLRAKVKRDQAANPAPPLPDQFCGPERVR